MPWPRLWSSSTPSDRPEPSSPSSSTAVAATATPTSTSDHRYSTRSADDGPRKGVAALTDAPTIVGAVVLSAALLGARRVYVDRLRRVREAKDISRAWLQQRRSILGTVTSVGDGDNFRLFHTPGGRLAGWGWLPGRRVPAGRGQLKGQTIHVRIAGVDAPELAHFGKPGQPYGREALDWLRAYVLHRRVRVHVLQADQYQRVVATAYVWRRWAGVLVRRRDVGLEMLRAGLATVYEARSGAAFGPGLEPKYREAEAWARARKRGMWAAAHLETPREYKTRHASGQS